jgi:predicted esterase YcpF (UPF0227 family)
MTIYIHGFSSSGYGVKAMLFKEEFTQNHIKIIAPSLSYIPDLAITTLEEIIVANDYKVNLIGSSLGGYYCIYLSNKYNLKSVLINPSIRPFITLKKVLGKVTSYYDKSSFIWLDSHIIMLKKLEVKSINSKNFMLLVQKGDENLDFNEAVNYINSNNMIVEEEGNHSFQNIQRHFKAIEEFLYNN